MTVTAIDLARDLIAIDDADLEPFLASLPPEDLAVAVQVLDDPAFARWTRSRRYVNAPVAWARDVTRVHLWSKQRQIFSAVRRHRYVAIPSCHGPGKSFGAAELACWWIDSHPPGSAFVVSTAPTGDQVRGVLWREMNRAHARGQLAGHMGVVQWTIAGELVAVGRKPADTNPAAFQGLHAEFILVIIDEADGVGSLIFEAAADTLATNESSRVVALGNPDRPSGPFFDACQPGSGWHVIRISAFDTPAFTGERVPPELLRVLVSKEWVEERRKKWGEDDPRWSSKVLGEAPSDKPSGVIPYSKLLDAMSPPDPERMPHARYRLDDRGRRIPDPEGDVVDWLWDRLPGPVEWGLDVGAGGDRTVVWERRGMVLCRRLAFREVDPEKAADRIEAWAAEVGTPETIKVDVIGVGWGLAGLLRGKARSPKSPIAGASIVTVNVGESGSPPSSTSPGFPKLRDQLWWEVGREPIIEGLYDLRVLAGPEHEDAVAELINPEWEADSLGRIKITPKDDTRKALGRSPDDADAILLAFYVRSAPVRRAHHMIARARIAT